MRNRNTYLFTNQRHATEQLIFRLENYKNKKCCVIAVSNNGVTMAKEIARKLNSDMFFIPSITMKDPAGSDKSLGVISFDYAVTYDFHKDIPQNYIYRQTRSLRSELSARYPGLYTPVFSAFRNRIVILVDDLVQHGEKILGLLETIQRQQPEKMVVAIPVITHDAAHRIEKDGVSTLFIHKVLEHSMDMAYLNYSPLTDREVTGLLRSAIRKEVKDNAPFYKTVTVKRVGRNSLNCPEPFMRKSIILIINNKPKCK